MKVTEEMIEASRRAMLDAWRDSVVDFASLARIALEAALADVPEPLATIINYDPKSPPSAEFPFRLTAEEQEVYDAPVCFTGISRMQLLRGAIKRALATLAAPAVEPLSEGEEKVVSVLEAERRLDGWGHFDALIGIIRKRFPKPEPARKTARELRDEIKSAIGKGNGFGALIDELVRRAEAGEP